MTAENRQFLDTNILVYAHDLSAGKKHRHAKALVDKLWETRTGCLSVQVLQEFYVTVTKKLGTPLDIFAATHIIESLTHWHVHSPGPQDVLTAIALQQRYQLSFWDAMIVQSAIRMECPLLWSEDLNPGQEYDGVQLNNPFAS